MDTCKNIAKHFKELYFGGNWTCSCLKDQLANITWQEATTKIYDLNTIATLTHHINYYVAAVAEVLKGHPLNAKDELSFSHPPIRSEEDWTFFLDNVWKDGEAFTQLLEQLPDSKLNDYFIDQKYGIYFRNLVGIIEHSHYHLGQISLIKKIIKAQH